MTTLHGFELLREREVPELNSWAKLWRHQRTGLELLSIENDDENKCFGVAFQTPSPDSTGVPHILEHAVLNGSRKYPVKEPFVELLKTSLNTFLNAMTFDDMTVYPVASTNLQDFYNLVDVYLDAVFYPLIAEKTFQQEGWHYEVEAVDAPLIFKGVVFNEMKAAYSMPERVLGERTRQLLLPDTPYATDPGGDPEHIPNLTYEQFVNFHRDYYHPSQARVFFYGDDDPAERLRMIDAFISEFERREVDTSLPLQPRWSAPRTATLVYDAGDADAESNKGLMTISWLLTEVTNAEDVLALEILSHILSSTPASPLRKALIESGLGEDVVGGLDTYMREVTFSTGLKGIKTSDANKVETLVLETLSNLADNGIDKATVEASLNTIEFQLREKNTGRFPRGLLAFIQVLPAWMHGGDPVERMAFEAPLNAVKARYDEDPNYFEHMIGEHFLNNPHRSTVILEPDPEVKAKREAAERARLDAYHATLDDAALQAIIADVKELQRIQETPDSPDALAKIPALRLSDIDREAKTIPQEELSAHDTPILYHDLPTSGIAYLDIGMNLRQLPAKYLPYVRLFGKALTEIGTETQNYVQLQQRIGAKTGGIAPMTFNSETVDGNDTTAYLFLRGKGMMHQTGDLLDILRDVLMTVRLDNKERFKQMVLEAKAGAEMYLPVAGNVAARARVNAHFTPSAWADEQMSGVSNLFFLRQLVDRIDSDWPGVLADLEAIRTLLVNRAGMLVNVTLDADNWANFRPQVEQFLGDLPAAASHIESWQPTDLPAHEGLAVPAQVNFVAKAVNLYEAGYHRDGSYITVLKHANLDYMWNKIRVMGGAYGGAMMFSQTSGVLTFLSWRDPNLAITLKNYSAAADYLRKIELDDETLEKAIIGAIGQVDSYLLPDAKGLTQMQRHLIGITDGMRQRMRDELLSTTVADFRAFGEALANALENAKVAVVGNPDNLKKANDDLSDPLTITPVL